MIGARLFSAILASESRKVDSHSMKSARILICDFAPAGELGRSLRVVLDSADRQGFEARHEVVEIRRAAFSPTDLTRLLARVQPDITFFVLTRSLFKRAKVLFEAARRTPQAHSVIAVIEDGDPIEMIEWLKGGAVDFVTAPLRTVEILPRVWRLLEKTRAKPASTSGAAYEPPEALRHFIGRDAAFVAQLKRIPMLARWDAGVLILGETGTGKEVVARAIHAMSPRAAAPFVPVNCGAIPVELAESELFGHERGAFTGAQATRVGLIEEAEGGTLFLDEVGCLPLLAQAKLLRFLQEKEFRPLGSNRNRRADVRIVAATNEQLQRAVDAGHFRQDLYYRLNVVPLVLPPLRERRDDIPHFARHFLERFAKRFQSKVTGFAPSAVEWLMAQSWPGNVRELEHAMERAVLLCEQTELAVEDFSPGKTAPAEKSFQEAKANVIAQFERGRIQDLLLMHKGNVSQAARAAHKNRRAFWELIRKYGIKVEEFREFDHGGFVGQTQAQA